MMPFIYSIAFAQHFRGVTSVRRVTSTLQTYILHEQLIEV